MDMCINFFNLFDNIIRIDFYKLYFRFSGHVFVWLIGKWFANCFGLVS